ncbi:MAG: hypothetical protein FJZ59_06430 [Chlamydiae bacterium]|jgi:predicted membrane protein|nr:hypothetical protein [Chlamydiota bacterium]
MAHPKMSIRRAKNLSSALFLIGLAIISLTNSWWPGIMLVIGIPLALRQFLLGRKYDAILSLVIFCGAFIVATFDVSWQILLPVLFIMGAVYILIKEFCDPYPTTEAEEEESLSYEIEEDDED